MTSQKLWTVSELSRAPHLTRQRIQQLCIEGRLSALKDGQDNWAIPDRSAQALLTAVRSRRRATSVMEGLR